MELTQHQLGRDAPLLGARETRSRRSRATYRMSSTWCCWRVCTPGGGYLSLPFRDDVELSIER
jgi:hypothetical protein